VPQRGQHAPCHYSPRCRSTGCLSPACRDVPRGCADTLLPSAITVSRQPAQFSWRFQFREQMPSHYVTPRRRLLNETLLRRRFQRRTARQRLRYGTCPAVAYDGLPPGDGCRVIACSHARGLKTPSPPRVIAYKRPTPRGGMPACSLTCHAHLSARAQSQARWRVGHLCSPPGPALLQASAFTPARRQPSVFPSLTAPQGNHATPEV